MARGSQQNGGGGRVARGKGAASSRKARPPARRASEAAPEPPFAEDEDLLEVLRTEPGRERAYAVLFLRAIGGYLTRDEVSALTLAKHIIDRFAKAAKDNELPDKLVNLEAEVTQLKALLSGAKGSALRADTAPVPPGVGDEQRPDVAPAESDPRGGEPHQP